jgi:hypothetical protein
MDAKSAVLLGQKDENELEICFNWQHYGCQTA